MLLPDTRRRDALRARLLAWYDRARRPLPWRDRPDPYGVWLSELMLQQTRVATVIPYYLRFRERFPTVQALAEAPLDDVLTEWAGLGYYRRARSLHAAAQVVAGQMGGRFPDSPEGLAELPGVGRYTAGAIASIAFGKRAPLVDGNVIRVLSRVFARDEPVGSRESERAIWALADALCPAERPGDFNQALMELGATVCVPRAPRCEACPLRGECEAESVGSQGALPVVPPKKAPTAVAWTAALVTSARGTLLARRVETGLFAGLWEPPMLPGHGRSAALAGRSTGLVLGKKLGEVEHVLTHRRLKVQVRLSEGAPGALDGYAELAFVRDPAGQGRALSTLARKVLALAPASVGRAAARGANR